MVIFVAGGKDMHWFYQEEIGEGEILLSPTESYHATRVLRLRNDEQIMITDGKGLLCEAQITKADPQATRCKVLQRNLEAPSSATVHLAVAPTKSIDRLEWLVEKATECGVSRITPLLCMRSERKTIKTERLKKISVAAMKQCRRPFLPQIDEMTPFNRLAQNSGNIQKFLAWCEGEQPGPYLGRMIRPGDNVLVLIGPEGDFTPDEAAHAVASGFVPVSLGPAVYRTETAGILACHLVQVINELTAG